MSFRVIITGSRDWSDRLMIFEAIMDLKNDYTFDWNDMVIVHGGCPTGADAIADDFAKSSGIQVEVHQANWELHSKAAGPKRNKKMVDLGADVVLAFPQGKSKGTRGCMKLAQDAGIPVRVYEK